MHVLVTCKYKKDPIKKQPRKGGDIRFESVDDDDDGRRRRTADGPLLYYKLTL